MGAWASWQRMAAFLVVLVLGAPAVRAEATEAQAEAEKVVKATIGALADGTSMSRKVTKYKFSSDWFVDYWQYSAFTWVLNEEQPSAADRLNGMTWKGTIVSTVPAYRKMLESSTQSAQCWSSWTDMDAQSTIKWSLQKVHGQWKNMPLGSFIPVGNEPPAKEDADRVLKRPPCS